MFARSNLWATSTSPAKAFALYGKIVPALPRQRKILIISLQSGAVPKVMSVVLIEPFDRWFLSLSKGSGTTRQNDYYTKFGGFDKLNHRNANLLDSPMTSFLFFYRLLIILFAIFVPIS